jgi:hypothetical protein
MEVTAMKRKTGEREENKRKKRIKKEKINLWRHDQAVRIPALNSGSTFFDISPEGWLCCSGFSYSALHSPRVHSPIRRYMTQEFEKASLKDTNKQVTRINKQSIFLQGRRKVHLRRWDLNSADGEH